MKKNIGNTDRLIRLVVGVAALLLGFSGLLEGTAKWIAFVVGILMVLTASIRFCPAYPLLGINTCEKKDNK